MCDRRKGVRVGGSERVLYYVGIIFRPIFFLESTLTETTTNTSELFRS